MVYSHHISSYSAGPPRPPTEITPEVLRRRRNAAHFLQQFVERSEGNGYNTEDSLVEIPEELARYTAVLDLLAEARKPTSPGYTNSGTTNSSRAIPSVSDVVLAALSSPRLEEMFLIGSQAFPELDSRSQLLAVADHALKFAHCWNPPVQLNGPVEYVKALEVFMDRRAYMIGVDTQGHEEANRRRMIAEIASGIRQIYDLSQRNS